VSKGNYLPFEDGHLNYLRYLHNFRSVKTISSQRKGKMLGLYRSFQLIHQLATELVSFILPTIIPAAESMVIVTSFATIRSFRNTEFELLFSIILLGVLTLIVLDLAITFAVNVTEVSKEFVKVAQKLAVKNPKYIQLYLNSCQPLLWRIGRTFTLHRDTFPRIVDEIILNILINLLLVF